MRGEPGAAAAPRSWPQPASAPVLPPRGPCSTVLEETSGSSVSQGQANSTRVKEQQYQDPHAMPDLTPAAKEYADETGE